jgi:NAD(P)-dependent dehydrogenase (short-subunit alcohol dehydrogenase family)/aryl carrier-like protein
VVLFGVSDFRGGVAGARGWPAPAAADSTSERIRQLRHLESLGGQVTVEQVDITHAESVAALVGRIIERYGSLNGVVHAAGVLHDGAMQLKSPDIAERVLAPKIDGTVALAHALREVECDFLVLCSSISAILGPAGQVDYCAANAFQDAFANAQPTGGTKPLVVSINWDAWEDVGMWARSKANAAGALALGLEARPERIRSTEGARAFAYALETGLSQVVVSPYDFAGLVEQLAYPGAAPPTGRLGVPPLAQRQHERPDVAAPFVAPRDDTEQQIAAIWQGVLGIERVGVHDNFFDLGGDSILGIQVVARARQVSIAIRPAQLFDHQTIAELARVVAVATSPEPAVETSDNPLIDLDQEDLALILAQTDRTARPS